MEGMREAGRAGRIRVEASERSIGGAFGAPASETEFIGPCGGGGATVLWLRRCGRTVCVCRKETPGSRRRRMVPMVPKNFIGFKGVQQRQGEVAGGGGWEGGRVRANSASGFACRSNFNGQVNRASLPPVNQHPRRGSMNALETNYGVLHLVMGVYGPQSLLSLLSSVFIS